MARALLLCILVLSCCSVPGAPAPWTSGRAFLPLAHRRGPRAIAETLRRDGVRADHVTGKPSGRTTAASSNGVVIPAELGYSVDSLEYVVTVGFGTPAAPQTVLMDTGSDFSWIQCAPCDSGECYRQKDPLFDPRNSSTYAPVPCDSGACKSISEDYGDACRDGSRCGFRLSYADGTNASGVYSSDKLTLAPGGVVENFRFGCGHGQEGAYDLYDGVIGLGPMPESLVSQASPAYGGAFSYCLPPTRSSAGFLALGRPSDTTSGFVFTPMHMSDHVPPFYRVTLTGISVGGRRLDVPPEVFPHGEYGMIVDTGTVVTVLPATAYAALRTAFRRSMAAYPVAPPMGRVDTCYNLAGYSNVTVPSVALAFLGGATVDLDVPSGILVEGCLAFAGATSDHGNGVIGNVNQRTLEVLYDSKQGSVGFRAGAC
ncbi:hypothetical protein ACP70R_047266 [Stipagrostis hirtigluma subsp. patula]